MDQTDPMNWQAFKDVLTRNPDKFLQFQYADGQFVDPSFHITEIKQASLVSVDCGGKMASWTEIIVQLWEPSMQETERPMNVGKALSIINLVEKSVPLNPQGAVKIEFGNSQFDTRQMYPGELIVQGDSFTVNLTPDYTQCKALSRGQTCGATTADDACCTPAPTAKLATQKRELAESETISTASCAPGSGCC